MSRFITLAVGLLLASTPVLAQDLSVATVLVDGEAWQLVAEGYRFTEGPAVDAAGRVYFTDVPASIIDRIELDGKVTRFAEQTANTNGLMFGPDGLLYGCRNGDKQIVRYDQEAKVQVLASDVNSNDLVVLGNGAIYFTDPPGGRVWYISPQREKRIVAEGLRPNGVILWPDQGTLVVTDGTEPVLWTFRVERDGSLTGKERYYSPLQMQPGSDRTGSDGMTVDSVGRLYVTTRVGLQMFDPTGRLGGTIAKPQAGPLSNVCFGGPKLDTLYVTAGDKVFKRKTQATGVRYAVPPTK
ncbi:MAG: SMP-30/gluconolactonase/LRE family protein [Planctomycetales bacterium]